MTTGVVLSPTTPQHSPAHSLSNTQVQQALSPAGRSPGRPSPLAIPHSGGATPNSASKMSPPPWMAARTPARTPSSRAASAILSPTLALSPNPALTAHSPSKPPLRDSPNPGLVTAFADPPRTRGSSGAASAAGRSGHAALQQQHSPQRGSGRDLFGSSAGRQQQHPTFPQRGGSGRNIGSSAGSMSRMSISAGEVLAPTTGRERDSRGGGGSTTSPGGETGGEKARRTLRKMFKDESVWVNEYEFLHGWEKAPESWEPARGTRETIFHKGFYKKAPEPVAESVIQAAVAKEERSQEHAKKRHEFLTGQLKHRFMTDEAPDALPGGRKHFQDTGKIRFAGPEGLTPFANSTERTRMKVMLSEGLIKPREDTVAALIHSAHGFTLGDVNGKQW